MTQSSTEPSRPAASDAATAAPPRPDALRDLTRGPAGTLVLLLLVFVCYAYGVRSGYVWDDDAYVSNNATLRSFGGLSRIWTEIGATPQYYPMTFTSFWLEVRLFGLQPGVSHAVNAILHAGSVLLLWKILRRLAVPGAWVAAAVFAVHPINVESVAWISERKNTLSLLLALSATWMYLRYAAIGVRTTDGPGEGLKAALPNDPSRLYRLFLALFVLALLAKTVVAVLPLMLGVVVWWKRGRLTGRDIAGLAPAVVLGVAAAALTSYIEHSPDFVGASGTEWDLSVPQRLMLVGQTAVFYFYKTVWPFAFRHYQPDNSLPQTTVPFFPISFNYERWTLDTASVVQWLPLAVVIGAVGILFFGVRRFGRGPLAAALLFLIGIGPVSGLVTFYPMRFSWVADHFAYVGVIGLIAGVVAAAGSLVARRPALAPLSAVGVVVLLSGMAGVSFWHARSFKDLETLWKSTLKQNPRSWIAALNYGTWLMNKGVADADELSFHGDTAQAAVVRKKFFDGAEAWFNEGIRLNPNAYEGYASLGSLAVQRGELDEALARYRRAEQVAADMRAVGYRRPAFYIGDILIAQGKPDEALALFEKLEPLESRIGRRAGSLFAQIRTRHGDILMSRIKGKIGSNPSDADRDLLALAMEQYAAAIEVGPNAVAPKLRLANILADTGYPREALQQVGDVFRIEPNNAEAKLITARIAASQSLYDAAAVQLENLLQLYPGYVPAHLELAKVFRTMGRRDEAVMELKRALALDPNQTEAKAMLIELTGATTAPASRPAK